MTGLAVETPAVEHQGLKRGRKVLAKEDEIRESPVAHRPESAVPIENGHRSAADFDGKKEDRSR
jgi:hypothetical protein